MKCAPCFAGLQARGNVAWDLSEHDQGLGVTPPAHEPVEGMVRSRCRP